MRAHSSGGAHLVRLHLADGNVTDAWEAADAFSAGHAWRELVDASEDRFPLGHRHGCVWLRYWSPSPHPTPSGPGHRRSACPGTRLSDTAGHRAEADAEIIRLREVYRRRPALMSVMSRAVYPPDPQP